MKKNLLGRLSTRRRKEKPLSCCFSLLPFLPHNFSQPLDKGHKTLMLMFLGFQSHRPHHCFPRFLECFCVWRGTPKVILEHHYSHDEFFNLSADNCLTCSHVLMIAWMFKLHLTAFLTDEGEQGGKRKKNFRLKH